MGIEAGPGLPIKKAFRIMTSSEDLSRRLSYRFRCNCDFHAPFNFTDFQLSEKYSRKFASFFERMLALLATYLCLRQVSEAAAQANRVYLFS